MKISNLRKSIRSGFSKVVESDWATFTALAGIFLLALFLRAYFGLETATVNGFLLSGGSDSYYHKSVIDYVVATGQHPYMDHMLNYPIGSRSGRPPLFDWSVAVSGMAFSPFFGDVDVSVWYSFLFSTAIWGALTVFPLYFMTKEAFDKRIGLLAAFFLAIMPAHIQRSPLTNGDHDSFVLFFVVLTFFFFLKAMKELKDREWITSWKRPRVFLGNVKDFFLNSRKAVLYSVMAGLSIGAIALAWTGFSYVIVILLIFYIVMVFINRLRNKDSFGLMVCFAITVGIGLLVALPWYASYFRIDSWYDTPFYMLCMAVVFGTVFVMTKKYPWMMVIPAIFISFLVGLIVLSFIAPTIVNNFFSGFGYFIQTKTYTTIAEAQAPNFSNLALSLGAVTFYLSLFGFAWSIILIQKKMQSDYIFLVIWIALSVYMAIAAARFIFNGAPAFAMTSAWISFLVIEKLDIIGARRTYRSIGGNRFQALRKSVKVRHVAGVLIMAFLVILPNVWFGTDASIPYEDKLEYDSQIYDMMPGPFRSENYQPTRLWYLGAFGYSLPLKTRYWPTAYAWLAEQDADIPVPWERPAALSWWDYGFEFIQEGKHPTVADNFLNGYQLAGNFIMSQNEKDAIALLVTRLIEGSFQAYDPNPELQKLQFDEPMEELLLKYGFDIPEMEHLMYHGEDYVNIVLGNPEKYGPRSSDLAGYNARYIYLRTLLTDKFTTEELVTFYNDIMETTGNSIRYFAVDTRMFPFSAQVTGIFYAPATLSDHRIVNNAPIDFYEIKAVSEFGTEFAIDEVPPGTTITEYRLVYKDMFYDSMFYRTIAGYSGKDIGQEEGIPGLTDNMAQQQIMPAWGMEHFRVVYRTSYYNPYPPAEVQNHTEDWRAMNFEDAIDLQRKIQEGTATGTVDASSRSSLSNGVVFIKYYHGAYINGTITVDGITPFSDVTVTVSDEFGIPHYTTKTDSEGRYSVLAPFGNNITLSASIGQVNNLTMTGATVVAGRTLNITDDQAMRVPQDADNDGILDYLITNHFEILGGNLSGKAFIDVDGNGAMGSTDIELSGAEVVLSHSNVETLIEGTTNATGGFEFNSIFPGDYEITVKTHGREFPGFLTTVKAGESTTFDLNVTARSLTGTVTTRTMNPVEADIFLHDETNGTLIKTRSNATGNYEFNGLLYGNYSLVARTGDLSSVPVRVFMSPNAEGLKDLIVYPSGDVKGSVLVENSVAPHAPLKFTSYDGTEAQLIYADSNGMFETTLPEGTYSIYSSYYLEGDHYVHLSRVDIERNKTTASDIVLEQSAKAEGLTYIGTANNTVGKTVIEFEEVNGNGRFSTVSSNSGEYAVMLPQRTYNVKVTKGHYYMGTLTLDADIVFDIQMQPGETIGGSVYYDINQNRMRDEEEEIASVSMVLTDSKSRRIDVYTSSNGTYEVTLDQGETYSVAIDVFGYDPYDSGALNMTALRDLNDISLVPTNVTLSGIVMHENASLNEQLTIRFLQRSLGAIEAFADTQQMTGAYEVSLRPGRYSIEIDHEIAIGEKFEDIEESLLEIKIGDEAKEKDITVVKKFEVNGNFSVEGFEQTELIGVYVILDGPEHMEFSAEERFSTFLREGTYSMMVTFFEDGGETFMNLSEFHVSAPTEIDIEIESTAEVKGYALHEGESIGETLNITFEKATGGSTSTVTSTTGDYIITLPPGYYTATINHTEVEMNSHLRFVRYTSSATVTVPSDGTVNLDLPLTKTLNNATLSGKVYDSGNTTISASLEFFGYDISSIDTTVQSQSNGDFTVSLHPGNYSLYVVHGSDALLTKINVSAEENLYADIRLKTGYRLEGTLLKDSIPISGKITLQDLDLRAAFRVDTDATGKFNTRVPEGRYEISSRAAFPERGIDVIYSNVSRFNLTDDKIVNVELEKVNDYEVDIYWNPGQRASIHANETVVYTVTVSNTGNVPDGYDLKGEPLAWEFEFSPSSVSMNYGDSDSTRTVEVRITAPPNALVDHEDLKISVESQNSAVHDWVNVEVDIYPYRGIELSLANETPVYNNTRMKYNMEILNTGNDDDNYTLIIANRNDVEAKGWKAFFNSSRTLEETATVTVSPNTKSTIAIELEAGSGATDMVVLAYSEYDRGIDDVLTIQLSLPLLAIDNADLDVDGERLTLIAPDNLVANALIVMVFVTIVSIAAILLLRRKKK